ncbi:MAG: hypothetical protein AB7O50_08310 [Pseudolabrys sp.]
MVDSSKEMRANAKALVLRLFKDAVEQRLWLTALFFLLARKKLVSASLNAQSSPQSKSAPQSPFIYTMR